MTDQGAPATGIPHPGLKQLRDDPNQAERQKKLMEAKSDLSKYLLVWAEKFGLSEEEILALCAFMTGAAIAFQDQRTMTVDMALEIAMANIQAGNQTVLEAVVSAEGSAQ